jgi:hypothetical protein
MSAKSDDPPTSEPRTRKRRRRTVACLQCRSRKLKCDREYPTCGRCLKGKASSECSYEDGFLWQQPKTVAASGLTDRFDSRPSDANMHVRTETVDGGNLTCENEIQRRAHSSTSTSPPASTAPAVSTGRYRAPDPAGRPSRAVMASVAGQPFLGTVMDSPISSGNPQRCDRRGPNGADVSFVTWRRDPTRNGSDWRRLTSPSQSLDLPNKVIIRGREYRTRFNGGGIVANLMTEVSIYSRARSLTAPHLSFFSSSPRSKRSWLS